MSYLKIPKNWTFKHRSVAQGFNQHVRESLPWYDLATKSVAHFGRHYIPTCGTVYDIGASTGNIGIALRETLIQRKARFFAIEDSEEMASHYKGPDDLIVKDAASFDYEPFDFAVCFLVLMFIPVSAREKLLNTLHSLTNPGGAILVVDKVHVPEGYLGTAFTRLTMQQKIAVGASHEDILKKDMSLAGCQRPINKSRLPHGSESFFQIGEFMGWVIPSIKVSL